MGEYHIIGGKTISGEVKINGGKNAILPILASVVLNGGTSIIHNCPKISDTILAIDILESIGCRAELKGETITVDSSTANEFSVPAHLVRKMRSSIIFLGGILGRFKKVSISYPGGCELGARPIDLHLKALKNMNVKITETDGFINCETTELRGAKINLDFPSVGATENIMLTAVLAKGETIVTNAAREPEIVDLQGFLNAMGAKIKGAGTDTIVIEGVNELRDVEYSCMPDRIVAGTLLVAAAITKGDILLKNVNCEHIIPITSKLRETGCFIKEYKNEIYLKSPQVIKSVDMLRTLPHPGFPTDMQPQMMAYLTIANGVSIVIETVFESRNKHVSELKRMGANIILSQDGMTSIIKGVDRLNGAIVESRDLRGGAALILAGLAAEGNTRVLNSEYVERGYESFEKTLRKLGVDITLVASDV